MTHTSRIRYWLPLLPLLGLLGVTYWLNQQVQPDKAREDNVARHDPDAIMENFSSTRLNEQGKPRYIVAAKKLQHFPDDDSTLLDEVNVTLLARERSTIHVSAKQGIFSSKGEDIFLHNDVRLMREAGAIQGELNVRTEYLHIVPNRDWADTDRDVTIVDAYNNIHARGLEIDNKAQTLKLLSQVRGEHVSIK